jgi:hypothetical protein
MFIIYTRRDRSRPVLFKFNETIKKSRKIILLWFLWSGLLPYQPHSVRSFPSITKTDFPLQQKGCCTFQRSVTTDWHITGISRLQKIENAIQDNKLIVNALQD